MKNSINELIQNIDSGARAAHAFIIDGRAGEARSDFVDKLTAGLECTSEDLSKRPCGRCPACLQTAAGTCMDIIRMNKSVSKSGITSYKTADASAFIERLGMGAYGRYLIGIIDDADSMSEVVQNKLLKTLEEPGEGTILILTAAGRDNLLETVRSRCSIIRLSDYAEASDEQEQSDTDIEKTAELMISGRFYELRAALDKHIKSKEDAFRLLDLIEDRAREQMIAGSSPSEMAVTIELTEKARMDISRDMNHSRALRRLYLESR